MPEIHAQGDETEKRIDLFGQHIPTAAQHPNFVLLKDDPRYEAARNLLTEIANSFVDKDGHYEREFQSHNFHARLWELYLHVYLHNAGLAVDTSTHTPDFEVCLFGEKVFIEAVTVNPTTNPARPDLSAPQSVDEIAHRLDNFMPIKFGSSLYSKLSKRYWELPHVEGHPLVIAIHDYHNDNAMTWSRTALSDYLYGVRVRIIDNKPAIHRLSEHEWDGKRIPSGFFLQPDAGHISAVLFGNQATIPKFNRMGKLAGLGCKGIKMIRRGYLYNPAAMTPIPFAKDMDDPDYEESWSDGLVMFHNPTAKYPVDPDMFSDISHIHFSAERGFYGFHQPYDVLSSFTIVVAPMSESTPQCTSGTTKRW